MPDLRLHDDDMPEHETWTASHPSPIDRRAENRDQRMTCPPLCHDAGSSIRRLYIYISVNLCCAVPPTSWPEKLPPTGAGEECCRPRRTPWYLPATFLTSRKEKISRGRALSIILEENEKHTHTENGATLATATSELKTKLAGWAFCRKLKHISLSRKCKRFLCLRAGVYQVYTDQLFFWQDYVT